MGIRQWLKNEWEDIKGHFKYDIYKWALGGVVVASGAYLVHKFQHLPDWLPYAVVFVLAVAVLFWLSKQQSRKSNALVESSKQSAVAASTTQFQSADEFYKTYDNALLLECEGYVRAEAEKYKPGLDREGYLIRIFASGFLIYTFDVVWFCIYKSQLLLMQQLNSKPLTTSEVRAFYDEAARAYLDRYRNYSFEKWLFFLRSWYMIAEKDADIFVISLRGKEFLKYLVHQGRNPNDRAL